MVPFIDQLPVDQHTALVVLLPIILLLVIWDAVWKGIAMWKAGRNNQLAWFVCILIFNTLGILPIVYIVWFQKKSVAEKNVAKMTKAVAKKKKR